MPDRGHGGGRHEAREAEAAAPPGLQIAEGGYRLVPERDRFAPAAETTFRFGIVDPAGEPLRDFDVEHEKPMHFIAVRRDLTGFEHVHPTLGGDGAWSTRLDLSQGGAYRVFADFTRRGKQRTLGADVHVDGDYRPADLQRAADSARSDGGLDVTLHEREGGRLEFGVSRDGVPVDDALELYLGARGHLVVLRVGDLAYLHGHPDGDELAFETHYPSAGAYWLFVQFRYEGRVHTAAFTQEVDG